MELESVIQNEVIQKEVNQILFQDLFPNVLWEKI